METKSTAYRHSRMEYLRTKYKHGETALPSQSFWKSSLAARCLLTRLCLLQQVSLKAGRNLITFQATGITYGAVEKREPVYIKSIQVQGNAPRPSAGSIYGVKFVLVSVAIVLKT